MQGTGTIRWLAAIALVVAITVTISWAFIQNRTNQRYSEPPPGYSIMTDHVQFKWQHDGTKYMSRQNFTSYDEAARASWRIYNRTGSAMRFAEAEDEITKK